MGKKITACGTAPFMMGIASRMQLITKHDSIHCLVNIGNIPFAGFLSLLFDVTTGFYRTANGVKPNSATVDVSSQPKLPGIGC